MKIDLRDIQTFYINMDKHIDRNKDMVQLGKDLEIANYKRVLGTEIVGHPKAGCATSHLEILNLISKPTVILEDDCVISRASMIIDVPDDADAIYLGLSEWGYLNSMSKRKNFNHKKHPNFKRVYKIDGMLATHAILYISPEYIEMAKKVAKWSAENDQHIDQGFALIQKYFNVYALAVPIFYQHSNTDATNIRLKVN
jgi:GR25 family glycosyltransferase involved in LPS biosynthesis